MTSKPVKKVKEYYEYSKCRDFLQEKYGFVERDYLGRNKYRRECLDRTSAMFNDSSWKNTRPIDMNAEQRKAHNYYLELVKNEPKHLDFWYWVTDHYEIHNGCYITFSNEGYDCIKEDWVKEIYAHYLDEFSDNPNWRDSDKYSKVEMYVSW